METIIPKKRTTPPSSVVNLSNHLYNPVHTSPPPLAVSSHHHPSNDLDNMNFEDDNNNDGVNNDFFLDNF